MAVPLLCDTVSKLPGVQLRLLLAQIQNIYNLLFLLYFNSDSLK